MTELERVADSFLAYQKLVFSPATHEQRRTFTRRLLRVLSSWGVVELEQLTLDVFLAYERVKIAFIKPSKLGCEKVSENTLKVDRKNLRVFLRYLFRKGHVFQDMSPHIECSRTFRPLPRALEPEVIEAWFSQCDLTCHLGLRDRALFELAYSSGLRSGEISALNLSDLDLGECLLQVTKSKTNEGRVTPFTRRAKHFLKLYLKDSRPLFPARPEAVEALWLTASGRQFGAQTIGERVRKIYQASVQSPEPITLHDLRHSCATHLLQNGAGVRQLQRLLGHRDINSTVIYLKTSLTDLKETQARCHPRSMNNPKLPQKVSF